jgi:hypothetical protein
LYGKALKYAYENESNKSDDLDNKLSEIDNIVANNNNNDVSVNNDVNG